ncbi:MAG: hypothetical protein IPN94_09955 [Sphingobacteriales bacterium]|nr:hypothetical protein [Sphingobacteriales bacterium]
MVEVIKHQVPLRVLRQARIPFWYVAPPTIRAFLHQQVLALMLNQRLRRATASTTIQPTCALATGTVVVTAPTGAVEYNIDGGTYQASGTFAGVSAGPHTILVRTPPTIRVFLHQQVLVLMPNQLHQPSPAPLPLVAVQHTALR